jgi:hypothetical protein
MATTNLMGDQEHDHAARLARFAIEAVQAASVTTLIHPLVGKSATLDHALGKCSSDADIRLISLNARRRYKWIWTMRSEATLASARASTRGLSVRTRDVSL